MSFRYAICNETFEGWDHAKVCQEVAELFPESRQVRLPGLAEADDGIVWQYAKANGFTLVSQDADFAEMAALSSRSQLP